MFYGKHPDQITFKITSDEFNGINRDSTNVVRPKLCRDFTLAKAIEENGQSRIWLGVHWSFDNTGGQTLGEEVAAKAYAFLHQPAFVGSGAPVAATAELATPAETMHTPVPATHTPLR